MAAILSRGRWVKLSWPNAAFMRQQTGSSESGVMAGSLFVAKPSHKSLSIEPLEQTWNFN